MSRVHGSLLNVGLVLLTATLVCGAVLAAVYDRAVDQSTAHTRVAGAPLSTSGVIVSSRGPTTEGLSTTSLDREFMWNQFPDDIRQYFKDPIGSSSVSLASPASVDEKLSGEMTYREGQCEHVAFSIGRCPQAVHEIAVTSADADEFGWAPGHQISVVESAALSVDPRRHGRPLRVVGVYTTDTADPFWFGHQPTGHAGHISPGERQGGREVALHDWWLTSSATFDEIGKDWAGRTEALDVPLDVAEVGIDELAELRPVLIDYLPAPTPDTDSGQGWDAVTVTAHSGLVALADDVRTETDQAGSLIIVFVVQLSLLTALTVWLVLTAAVGQRRSDAAVLRLRGGSRRSVRRFLLGRLLPVIAVGYVGGLALALALSIVIRARWLPGAPFEVTPLVMGTAVGVAMVLLVFLQLALRRVASESPAELLRSEFRAGGGAIAGVALAVVVTASLGAVVAFMAGSLTGPVGMAAPGLLALGAGLLVAPTAGRALSRLGTTALGQGRLVRGLGLIQAGRREGGTVVITVIAVAAALLVFAVQSVVVGERNREDVANAENGAPAVLRIDGSRVAALRAAIDQADPSGRQVTPVVETAEPGGGTTTLAVVPAGFAAVTAAAPGRGLPVDSLTPDVPDPITITGDRLELRVRAETTAPVEVRVLTVDQDSHLEASVVGEIHDGHAWQTPSVPVGCEDGCALAGLAVRPADGGWTAIGSLQIDRLRVSGQSVDLGLPGHWRGVMPNGESGESGNRAEAAGSGMEFAFDASNSSGVEFEHASRAARLPSVFSGNLPADAEDGDFVGSGLDGVDREMTAVVRVLYVPGAPPDTAVVSLDALQRDGANEREISMQAWLASDASSLIDRVSKAAADHGLDVVETNTAAGSKAEFDRSAVGRGLTWGIAVGVVAGLLALLVMVIAVAVTWRARASDYRAWGANLLGTKVLGRAAVAELLPAPVIGVVLGVVCGLIGTRVALPHVPFFTVPPEVPVVDVSPDWTSLILVAVGALAVVGAVAVLAAIKLRRQELER